MRFSTLTDWLTWQESLHPSEIELGLERVRSVLQRLDHQQLPRPTVITVAGTNGKGSCVALLESIYRAAGYRVGCYTSPHLLRYNERIRISGEEVADATLCRAFERIDAARQSATGDPISLTYFEFGTLAAIDIFARTELDLIILEVGLGGRLDAVNLVDPDVAVITSIALDHSAWLGDNREAIGVEKAGIMRHRRPVVCGDPEPPASLLKQAHELQAPLFRLGEEFGHQRKEKIAWEWWSRDTKRSALPLPNLRGAAQLNNAATALMVTELLQKSVPLSTSEIRSGLLSVTLAGRFQVLPGTVTTILDVAHNPEAAATLARSLGNWPIPGRTYAVVAIMADKDISGIIQAVQSEIDHWYLCTLPMPRAATVEQLQHHVVSPNATLATNPLNGWQSALSRAEEGDRIVVFGSFFSVAEVLSAAYNGQTKNFSNNHLKGDRQRDGT